MVPEGTADDQTRQGKLYDATFAFLRNTGIKQVDDPVADDGARADDWQYKTPRFHRATQPSGFLRHPDLHSAIL
jgi:hypothetical protein